MTSLGQLTPVAVEVSVSNKLTPELEKQHGGLDPDARLQSYVDRIGRKLLAFSRRSDFTHSFSVLKDPKTVNAFALGNGKIYVTRGLLTLLDDEAQLAEIVGHEIGHVAHRHMAHKLDLSFGAQGVAMLVEAIGFKSDVTDAVLGVGSSLLVNGFGRDQELESDASGLIYMASAGYDPHAAVDVFRKFQKLEGKVSAIQEFFRSHPTAKVRVEELEEVIDRRFGRNVGIRNAEVYKAMVEGKELPKDDSDLLPTSALEWGVIIAASAVDTAIMSMTMGSVGANR